MQAVLRTRGGGGYVHRVPPNDTSASLKGARGNNYLKQSRTESSKKFGAWGAARGGKGAWRGANA